jgi:hypothetical protein
MTTFQHPVPLPTPDPPASISYKKLRQTIGWLGLALPLAVVVVTKMFGNCSILQDSISHYYYTIAGPVFVGIFWGLALVQIYYPTLEHDPRSDGVITTVSGICALCIAMFPTGLNSNPDCVLFSFGDSKFRTGVHYGSAAVMLSLFSYMSYCIFTRTYPGNDLKGPKNLWKRRRNHIYRVCGVLTFLSIITIGVFSLWEKHDPDFPIGDKYVYWLEVAALLPFGTAWVIKGGFLFTDEGERSTAAAIKDKVLFKK